jgi:hypothetical protein
MSPVEVVKALIAEGVEFSTDGQRIIWRNDDEWMKPEVIAIIKAGRAEVIRYLVKGGRKVGL